ncbi:hypothetical protein BOX15_Mlig001906g1, partial [Macrostomum lignano]
SSSCLAASAAAASSDLANKLDELTEQLKRQLEFYLGEGNLLKDRFLRSELDKTEDGYLPLRLFLRFNRVIEFCHRAGVKQRDQILARLRVAIGASRLLALDDDGLRVRRAAPLRQLEPVDERTVYVDGLCGSGASGGSGCKVDRDSVAKMFSTVGQVLYISLPCYRTTGDSKGFAFVEFETSAEAQLAVDRLNSVPRSQWRARLPKFSSQVRSLLRAAEVLKIDTTQLETALYDQGCGGDSGDSVGTSSTSGSASGKRLAVMPKAEWERLRQEMKSARDREIAKLRSRVQKAKSAEANRANVEDAAGGAAGPPAHLRFSAGLIVRLTDADGGLTRKRIRDQLPLGEARDAVAYIDIDEDGRGACLRCRDAAAADRLLALPQLTTPPLSAELLVGQQERDYWDKIRRDWEEKHRPGCPLSGPARVKRQASPASVGTSGIASGSTSGVASGSTSGVASGSTSGVSSGSTSGADATSGSSAKRPKRIVFDSDED